MIVEKDRIWTRDFLLTCLFGLATMMTFQLLIPTMPRYVVSLGGSSPEVGFSLAIFSLGALVSRILSGWMVDRYGQKPPALVGAVLFVICAPLYLVVHHLPTLLLLRALHGIAFGFLTNGLYSIGADLAPPSRRGEALGHLTNTSTLSSAVGPALAASLLGLTGYALSGFDMVFLVCCAMAVIAIGAAFGIRETRTERGAARFSLAALFDVATMPLAAVSLLVQFAAGGVLSFVPLYLPVGLLPVFYLSYAAALLFIRPMVGRLGDRIERRRLIMPVLIIAAVGVALLALGKSLPIVLISALLFGIGFGAVSPTMTAIVVDRTPPARRGIALSTFTSSIDIGIASGASVLGFVAVWFGLPAVFLGASIAILLSLILFVLVADAKPAARASAPR